MQLQLLPPQLPLPQQHQMMISRMMIQQQLPPPKPLPLLHISEPPCDVDRSVRSYTILCAKAVNVSHKRQPLTSPRAACHSSQPNTPFSISASARVRPPSGRIVSSA